MKTLFTFLLFTFAISSFAQDTLTYKAYRSVWSIIPRFGVGDKQTLSAFTTYGSIGLRREFALFSFYLQMRLPVIVLLMENTEIEI